MDLQAKTKMPSTLLHSTFINPFISAHLIQNCEFLVNKSVSVSAGGEHNFCGMLPFQTVYVIYSCRAGRAAEPDTRLDMTMKLRVLQKSAPPPGGAQRQQTAEQRESI